MSMVEWTQSEIKRLEEKIRQTMEEITALKRRVADLEAWREMKIHSGPTSEGSPIARVDAISKIEIPDGTVMPPTFPCFAKEEERADPNP